MFDITKYNYIVGYDEIHKEMIRMLDSAKNQSIYIVSFKLDVMYIAASDTITLYDIILAASRRNNHVYICHSDIFARFGVESYNDRLLYIDRLESANPTHIHVKRDCTTHARYVFDGKHLLLCGGNYSSEYSGSHYIENSSKFKWWDNALSLPCSEPNDLIPHIFHNGNVSPEPYPLLISGKLFAQELNYRIINSTHHVRFETQYFFTGKHSKNRVLEAIVDRICRAIHDNTSFTFELYMHEFNASERLYSANLIMLSAMYESLHQMVAMVVSRTSISLHDLNQYIKVSIFNHDVACHVKLYTFDGKDVIFTSANILDACLGVGEVDHKELGVCIESVPDMVQDMESQLPRDILIRCITTEEMFHYEPKGWIQSVLTPSNPTINYIMRKFV